MSASADGSNAMLSLKNKIQMMREQVDKYKEMYEKNCADLATERSRKLELQDEVINLKQRIITLEAESQTVTTEMDSATEKLELTSKAADDLDRARRALEHRKNMDEDRLTVLEDLVKEANSAVMESERRYDDLMRKLLTSEADVERMEEKAKASELKTKSLEGDMHTLCNKIKVIQNIDEQNAAREEKYEATVADLEIRLKNTVRCNEDADSLMSRLQQQIQHLQDEVQKANQQNQMLHSELDSYSQELHAI